MVFKLSHDRIPQELSKPTSEVEASVVGADQGHSCINLVLADFGWCMHICYQLH